jgi:hypothetical protein
MANLNAEFATFDEQIKLDWDDAGVLRERRDVILRRLHDHLGGPSFDPCNQGSYDLRTGVHPLQGDYDIDVALRFNTTIDAWPDPVALKQRVLAALEGFGSDARVRQSCVTVFYRRGDEPLYHVDLAVYAHDAQGHLHLAVGKVGATAELKSWVPADPQALGDHIDARFQGEDKAQLRRVLRCLKRWKDVRFSSEGDAAPKGIGLTAAALQWFRVNHMMDPVDSRMHYDDAAALLAFVQRMHANANPRLVARLPVVPFSDPFTRMNDRQMEIFRDELAHLETALRAAHDDNDPAQASETLRRLFGADFPRAGSKPRRKTAAIVSSGSAA